jgi:8-oxo-dGTP diphosphatase
MTVNVQAAIYKSGKWFIIERSQDDEIWEELGISIDNLHYVCSASFMAEKEPVVNVVFFATYSGHQALSINPDEVAELYRLSVEEVEEHEQIPQWTKAYVKQANALLLTLAEQDATIIE